MLSTPESALRRRQLPEPAPPPAINPARVWPSQSPSSFFAQGKIGQSVKQEKSFTINSSEDWRCLNAPRGIPFNSRDAWFPAGAALAVFLKDTILPICRI